MSKEKPSLLSGFRDFSPEEVAKRDRIFNTARSVFEKYGYMPIQTPAMERLSVLSGKYGEEGEQLMFKVLNSGDYLNGVDLSAANSRTLTPKISERALRYDLTVPFARYVVMNQSEITLPFKRYQIQNVWRADRPGKGRYREFYQCDVDVVGSASLLHEAEFVAIYDEILSRLGLTDFTIVLNHRKILNGVAEAMGCEDKFVDLCTAIDKLDKIGVEGVEKELSQRGFSPEAVAKLLPLLQLSGTNDEKLAILEKTLAETPSGLQGITELRKIIHEYLPVLGLQRAKIVVDFTLARGLNYYTGTIFEVKAHGVEMGSIGGGGRYDDLTGMFGLKNLTGVGVSLGADRVYDVMLALNLFQDIRPSKTKVLVVNFGAEYLTDCLQLVADLRKNNIPAEIYPEEKHKLNKQFGYADKKAIPYVVIFGESEKAQGIFQLKNMKSGEQTSLNRTDLLAFLSEKE